MSVFLRDSQVCTSLESCLRPNQRLSVLYGKANAEAGSEDLPRLQRSEKQSSTTMSEMRRTQKKKTMPKHLNKKNNQKDRLTALCIALKVFPIIEDSTCEEIEYQQLRQEELMSLIKKALREVRKEYE